MPNSVRMPSSYQPSHRCCSLWRPGEHYRSLPLRAPLKRPLNEASGTFVASHCSGFSNKPTRSSRSSRSGLRSAWRKHPMLWRWRCRLPPRAPRGDSTLSNRRPPIPCLLSTRSNCAFKTYSVPLFTPSPLNTSWCASRRRQRRCDSSGRTKTLSPHSKDLSKQQGTLLLRASTSLSVPRLPSDPLLTLDPRHLLLTLPFPVGGALP
mmetsp:Transcript_13698/g.32421  ORF Transcript_13698/g.32421 Transcript_13698/m.32421 type:complete len:207 (-) Transcript_13698:371-991(-)